MKIPVVNTVGLNMSRISTLFILTLIMLATIVIDTAYVKFFGLDESQLPSIFTVAFFVGETIILFITSIILLRFSKSANAESSTYWSTIKYIHRAVELNQYVILMTFITIIFSMLVFSRYHIFSIWVIILVTHIQAIVLLVLSVYRFILWLKLKGNNVILLYSIAFSCLVVTILASILITNEILPHNKILVNPVSSHLLLMSFYSNHETIMLKKIHQIFFFVAFLISWVATIFLLRHYSKKFGKAKFLIMICIPLLYFLSQFEIQFIDIFREIRLQNPVVFSIAYFVFFSATKQVGGLLFSLSLWTAAKKFKQQNVRNSLILSAIGVTFIFASDQIDALILVPYPPFGLVTISMLGLAAYFIFRGFLNTAVYISRDVSLRKELHKEIENNMSLLKTMGLSEMERNLANKCKPLIEKAVANERYYKEFDIDLEDAKILVHEVLKEVYSKYPDAKDDKEQNLHG